MSPQLPTGWKFVKLGDICEFVYGNSLPEKVRIQGPVKVFGSNGQVGSHNAPLTSSATIIIGRKGSVGEVTYSGEACFPIDTTYYVTKEQTQQNIRWLYYALKSLNMSKLSLMVGVPGLNRNDAYKLKVALPPLDTQHKIVNILDEADSLRKLRKQADDKTKELIPALFDEMFGDVVTNSKGYKVTTLGEICNITTGKLNANAASANGVYPFFTCSKEVYKINTYSFDCEAMLLSGNNASGDFDVKYYKGKFDAYQRTYVITIKNTGLYNYQFIRTIMNNNLFKLKQSSIGGLTKYLTLPMITSVKIPEVPIEIQNSFGELLESYSDAYHIQLTSSCKLEDLFNSLLEKCMTGQIL
ncbi:restriction endonuclease subunit S [Geomonas nitrogeniifigens]|uniref:restriction endonuclease subunit S n=1 Tax=Geomonas diazotrophica TaxID=2843197 RepID=UPI001C2C7D81|nr:restriction endonuclease subunit S [Geomonas nitrogeniifigens]QXE88118.1 restriction endonuclease subunit S [Geomonas nitrogeniifigens]